MDYERIEKPVPQRGGLSPGKLRAMLLGVKKRRNEDEEEEEEEEEEEVLESQFTLRCEASAKCILKTDGGGVEDDDDDDDECKDVDIVSSFPECSTIAVPASSHIAREQMIFNSSRLISQLEDSLDSESVSSSTFEFHRGSRSSNGAILKPPFTKTAPSKWDDAQKWIANPAANRPKFSSLQQKKSEKVGFISRQSSVKFLLEDHEDAETKRIDLIQGKKELTRQTLMSGMLEPYPGADSCEKYGLIVENLVTESSTTLSRHDPSASVQNVTAYISPASTARSVAMRDMGTEMTPIASQEPSRTGTPVRATTPMRSPSSSRLSSPGIAQASSSTENTDDRLLDCNREELSEQELQIRTRREIMILGTQLGKTNIAAWAGKEEENVESVSLKSIAACQAAKSVIETRAAAWEEAEKAKDLARFKREEIRIEAWENHQKAKAEAERRKIEVEVEHIRARAQDRLMSKLAAAKHKAVEMRAGAEAKRNKQAAKAAEQAEYIRRTGRIPSGFCCWSRGWCSEI